ncbi:hemin uptake protein HemP [Parvibaculum lavamentivorans]|nr:hemin uptake protein HemP [Parvibaculum lavamentivorans]
MTSSTAPDRTIRVTAAGATPAVASADLFAGGRELIIRHGEELYRLRLTNSNKLILIK